MRRRGFTLIELLVVIAIIGILAAMLFPVFARARESARKIQCLSNVKNIAMAVNMYVTDYDRLPPSEHRADVTNWFTEQCGDANGRWFPSKINPYLRWAVVFDEYIKNRDVWRCPSARQWGGAQVILPGPDWFDHVVQNFGVLSSGGGVASLCLVAFPTGWGGTVTDTPVQVQLGGPDTNGFEQTIGTTEFLNEDLNLSQVADPVWYVVVGDIGQEQAIWGISRLAFPEACRAQCGTTDPACCSADWDNCSWSQNCGIDYRLKLSFWNDPNVWKRFTRHMGGSNVGFLDGHAKWWPAMSIVANAQGGQLKSGDTTKGQLRIGPDSVSTPYWGCMCKYGE